jgi:hypothetical protein
MGKFVLGDSRDGADRLAEPVLRSSHAAKKMLPKLRVMLAALIATCAVALAASAGLLGMRTPGKSFADVPDVNRRLVQQAIVEEPDSQSFRMLAYSRRADQLMRLRDLPEAPARAIVEYAERARVDATEAANEPAATPAAPAPAEAAPSPPTVVANVPAAPVTAPAPAPATAPAPITDAAAPTTAATEPAAAPDPATTARRTVPSNDPATRDDRIRVANVATGPEVTASINPPDSPLGATKQHRKKAHRRPQAKAASLNKIRKIFRPRIPPIGPTGFPIDPPQGANDGRGNDALVNARLRNPAIPGHP